MKRTHLSKILIITIGSLFLTDSIESQAFPLLNDTTGKVGSKFLIDVNNFKVPINNIGMIADIDVPGPNYGELNGDMVLFSAGFMLAGEINNDIWMSNVSSASLVEDYLPGVVGDTLNLSKDIFVVRKSDPAFSSSWQDWKDAVQFGAIFYDGDFDGIYNPVDKNWNGTWNINEDMPYLLGDITAWCVYNDSKYPRVIQNTYPVGIEIQQTVFASSESNLRNTIFILYSIINRGLIFDSLGNVYFSVWSDPDIGDPIDDLAGCDTTLFSGYDYNNGSDSEIGDDPPAIFFTLLQGSIIIDTAQSGFEFSAINNFGFYYGIYSYEGHRNLNPSSFQNYLYPDNPFFQESKYSLYNRMRGLKPEGGLVDPCVFSPGIVIPDTLCNTVNPLFIFSGNPIQELGWLNILEKDQRDLFSIGPFNLMKNEPQHIVIAYTGAKGNSALNSITEGREIVQGVIQEYKSNFPSLTYQPGKPYFPVTDYVLYQNYPNPFNLTTTIRYELPQNGVVTIDIYDILGQKVRTILNKFQKADRYEIQFNAISLASGVYIYRIKVNEFITSKKMLLLK